MGASASIMIVEDESDVAALIEFHLARLGHDTHVVSSGRTALDAIRQQHPNLVVLDLMLPDLDGLEVCQRLRAQQETSQIPIVMVTARGEEADIVRGLELGADDYIVKPFSPRVLTARIGAVLRRQPVPESGRLVLLDGRLVIDDDRHKVYADDERVELTPTQYRMLQSLARHPGFARTRQQITQATHGDGTILSSRAVDVHMAALRQKLGPIGQFIETVRGVGYRFTDPADT